MDADDALVITAIVVARLALPLLIPRIPLIIVAALVLDGIDNSLLAIVVLEPDASATIDAQYADQRRGMEGLARGLQRAGRLRDGRSVARAAAALHALTSVETFMLLRRDHGLPLARVKETIVDLSRTMLAESG